MTPNQGKAVRVLLGWSIERLAAYSDMSIHAVRMFEQTRTVVPMRGRSWKMRIDASASLHAILCSRENPKIGHRVEPDTTGVQGMRNFRVFMWTEYTLEKADIEFIEGDTPGVRMRHLQDRA